MSALDHAALVQQLMPAMLEAGALVLGYRQAGVATEHKADGSPVSRADREAEQILLDALARVAPGIPVIAEEAVSAGRVPDFTDHAFLVDALDGTREYLAGGDDFTVNIGLVQDGTPCFGLLLAPAIGRLFATLGPNRAAAATFAPADMSPALKPVLRDIATVVPDPRAVRVVMSRSHRSAEAAACLKAFSVGNVQGIGSSLKFGLLAAGEADLYPRFGPTSAWDIAAGHAILLSAGGDVTTADRQPLRYLQRRDSFRNPSFVAWGRLISSNPTA